MAANPSHHTPNSTSGGASGPAVSAGTAAAATGGSLAFSNPSSGKIDQQRKILEELERQKKQLAKGNLGPSAANASPAPNHTPNSGGPASGTLSKAMEQGDVPSILTQAQKAAMELANKSSFGYFIPQDSAFGNSILPVVPRLQPK
ncbi:hypothetical protein TCAL_06524 [Tigriopus californicus]|uniref:SOSS complex subunit C homolog n=1 Tax=Tigriopus californicus TaxID=6832 RepID=A0A553NYD3_TIGCA|nr:SOSS complex subunit C homolog B-like [Tigriopus californicus]TRY70443.1 hypothetical protein TCAL_06524 [Tigriopus californicus]|eukprot:TCALIF_06524-PA protein Name:"Similar to GK20175 SOSS complex subunit C homolog B (Drosophila willistoni)" AED:0.58 eAED:0.58 QI:0/-1/0/1/-1/1/1/0/145